MAVSGTLYTPDGYHRSWRALIAAKYSRSNVKIVNFIPGETDSNPSYLQKFPPATVPVFEGDDNICLFDVNAIAYYLGTESLRGFKNGHLVTQWCNFADNNILPSVATWVYPCFGITQFNKQNTDKAKEHLKTVLTFLNNYLSKVTFLVGDRLSQADITVFTAVHPLFKNVYEEKNRKPFPHVVRWYMTVANQPEVREVVGISELCVKAAQYDSKRYAELHSKKKEVKTEQKTPSKPEEQPVKDKEEKPKCSKNALAQLPLGSFDLEAFKRVYSNTRNEQEVTTYFWDNFDSDHYSIWYCEYNYPEELELIFMTCNLIGGFFQRLEKMNKFAFASMCIFGENNKNNISGLWVWRGSDLIFSLDEDLQVDYESYSWKKLEPSAAETKQLLRDYFMQDFPNKPFNQGKIFK